MGLFRSQYILLGLLWAHPNWLFGQAESPVLGNDPVEAPPLPTPTNIAPQAPTPGTKSKPISTKTVKDGKTPVKLEKQKSDLVWHANPSVRFGGGALIGVDHTIDVITASSIAPAINRMDFELEGFIPYYPRFPELNWLGLSANAELWLPVSIAIKRENNQRVGNAKVNERAQSLCALFAPLFGTTVRQQIRVKGCPSSMRKQTIDFDETSQGTSQILFYSQNSSATLGYAIMPWSPIAINSSISSTFADKTTVSETSGNLTSEQEAKWKRMDYRLGVKSMLQGRLGTVGWLGFDGEAFVNLRQETGSLDASGDAENYSTLLYGFMLGISFTQ